MKKFDKKAYDKKWYNENRESKLKYQNQYNNNPQNKAWVLMTNAMRRVERKGGRVESDQESMELMEKVYQRAIDMTVLTGIPHVVDHILAIVNGGAHSPDNLQVIAASENKRKWLNHDKHLLRNNQTQNTVHIENVNGYLNDGIELTADQYLTELEGEEE